MPSSVFAHKPLDGLLQYLPCRQWQVMLTGHCWQIGLRVAVGVALCPPAPSNSSVGFDVEC